MKKSIFSSSLQKTSELDRLADQLREKTDDGTLSEDLVPEIMVITDEILSNVLKYGGGNQLTIHLHKSPEGMEMEFIDNGAPFNPLEAERPNLDTPVEKRDIGGLGLELVIAMTDTQEYKRVDNKNHLMLTRRL